MTLINIVVSLVILAGLSIYEFIHPKKNVNFIVLLLILLTVPVLSTFRTGSYESGDFNLHLYRAVDFIFSLKEGNLMPSWAGMLNNTYGYPLFIFNYALPYYIISLFYFLGFGLIGSMKMFLVINFYLSGLFMYLLGKRFFNDNFAGFTAAIFYQFAPYHLVDQYFKIAIGEIMAFTFLPLVFYFSLKILKKPSLLNVLITSIALSLLILSHALISFVTILLLFSYALISSIIVKNFKVLIQFLLVFLVSLLSTSYMWLGPVLLSKFTIATKMNFEQINTGLRLDELLFSPYYFGFLYQGPFGQISSPIGYSSVVVFFAVTFLVISSKNRLKEKIHTTFWIIAFVVFVFLSTIYSEFLWGNSSFMSTASSRMMLLVTFTGAILAGNLVILLKKKRAIIFFLLGFTIYSSILNWSHRAMVNVDDDFIIKGVSGSTNIIEGHWYANSKWRELDNQWFQGEPESPIKKEHGLYVSPTFRNSTKHTYIISSREDISIVENTLYFPGWNALVDGEKVKLHPDTQGRIKIDLEGGIHFLKFSYQDVFHLRLLKILSSVMLLSTITYIILDLSKRKLKFKKLFGNYFNRR